MRIINTSVDINGELRTDIMDDGLNTESKSVTINVSMRFVSSGDFSLFETEKTNVLLAFAQKLQELNAIVDV